MAERPGPSRWTIRRLLLVLAIAAVTGLLWLVVVMAPPWFVDDDSLEGLKAQNEVRTTLLQGLAGLALLVGVYFTWRQLHTAREGQITERYTRAIDQLGHGELDVRLGGIYALERIARDSPADRRTIAEVLTAFIRTHAPWPPRLPGQYKETASIDQVPSLDVRAPDVQAALTVLGRGQFAPPEAESDPSIDLRAVDLRRANLTRANLQNANLYEANLQKATLTLASLQNANLYEANLQGAFLFGANLQNANLRGANLHKAPLFEANLQNANLYEANLQKATLTEANLQGAVLIEANLQGAVLIRANLQGAVLIEANLQGTSLQGANLRAATCGASDRPGSTHDRIEADHEAGQMSRPLRLAGHGWPERIAALPVVHVKWAADIRHEAEAKGVFSRPTPCPDCGLDPPVLFYVGAAVWQEAGNPDGWLCPPCLERRLGRVLTANDLDDDVPMARVVNVEVP